MASATPYNAGGTIEEWREGRDKIIERKAGPGEDVEVEVLKNYYPPNEPKAKSPTKERKGSFAEECRDMGQRAKMAMRAYALSPNNTEDKAAPMPDLKL
ncbi:hypothetical protein FIBSPDRAFT_1039713 [Athelia psychrophila]|uniref:Uncharacterized protein n=1 Tax=Athelia psychrophila TaxID=1759441 RepID=A0A166RIX9_9AGAM|nr:hypothetical protein FIBSPDRAFT_1039713 [Fibularhizoctonia sp. CBS 109695]